MQEYETLKRLVQEADEDVAKAIGGNKAAGTRVRNAMQELKTLAQTIRTEVQAIKNEGKPASSSDSEDQPD